MKHRAERNWSQYNQKLKTIASIDFFILSDAIEQWHFSGKRAPGGKIIYSDHVIELCLLMREFYKLAYRQTQGFVESVLKAMQLGLPVPDYTTLSRRAGSLAVILRRKISDCQHGEGIVVAIDSTGLSLYSQSHWYGLKHTRQRHPGYKKWRKLHVAIDIRTGEILTSRYTSSTANDGPELAGMLDDIDEDIKVVCGDMAYDTVSCRKAIHQRGARQLIPPVRHARLSQYNRNIRQHSSVLRQRDDAIHYIKHNTINGDQSLARKSWMEKSGYHARSLVETTMLQIKQHCRDYLSNKREDTRATQARIKCKVVNLINAA
jgi:Transposase DDE domain